MHRTIDPAQLLAVHNSQMSMGLLGLASKYPERHSTKATVHTYAVILELAPEGGCVQGRPSWRPGL